MTRLMIGTYIADASLYFIPILFILFTKSRVSTF